MSETSPDAKPVKPDRHKTTQKEPVPEVGGQTGPDPTRYGDWEKNGRVSDF